HGEFSPIPNSTSRLTSYLEVGDERQVVGRHQRLAGSRQLDPDDLDVALIVDVIQVQNREDAWIGAPAAQVRAEIDSLQALRQQRRRQTPHPLVEVAEHHFRAGYSPVAYERGEALGLEPTLEIRGAKMHVVQMQERAVQVQVDALATARLTGLPREVVLRVVPHGEAAEDDVAEERAAQVAGRRHHPAHAERRP